MQVAITCRHGSITDEVRDYISRKSEKLVTYFERVTSIEVMVGFENTRVKVEILVDVEHRPDFVARAEGEGVPAIFDQALHKMEQQVRKYKEKIQDHRRDRPLNEIVRTEAADEENE